MRISDFKSWVFLLLIPIVVVGWTRLRLETDILSTLPQDIPQVSSLQLLRDGFEGGNDLVICIEAASGEAAEDSANALTQLFAQHPHLVSDVRNSLALEKQSDTGPALLAWMIQNSPPEKLHTFRAQLTTDLTGQIQNSLEIAAESPDLQQVQTAAYDPLGLISIIDPDALKSLNQSLLNLAAEDGTLQILHVTPAPDVGNYKSAAAWLHQIKTLAESALAPQNITLSYTGEPAFQAEIGAGIEQDMTSSIGLTEGLIALLFWFLFRRLKPLLWIQGLLIVSMAITLGLGGLLVGRLSILSLGFAAIVLGIIVDYAVLIIQEARQHPNLNATELRRRAAPGIIAGACTTATVFACLSFSSLPGLAEMGFLVALGVVVGLGVMLGFAPLWASHPPPVQVIPTITRKPHKNLAATIGTLALLAGLVLTFVFKGLPPMQSDASALRPTHSPSMDTLEHIQDRLGQKDHATLPLLVTGPEHTLKAQCLALDQHLTTAAKSGALLQFSLPSLLVSDPTAQSANASTIDWLLNQQSQLERALDQAGFTVDAMHLLRGVCDSWRQSRHHWPQSESTAPAGPILKRLLATGERALAAHLPAGHGIVLASVSIPGTPRKPDPAALHRLQDLLAHEPSAQVAGWETLGRSLANLAQRDLNRQLIPSLLIIALTLIATFRNGRDLILSVLLLATGLGALAATMSLLGQTWNLASLAAIPLLLGTGIDYGIHILLALKRSNNAIHFVQRTTGKAIFFSGMTTVIAFASLIFSSNRGLSNLGLACCVGTLWILLITLWLLPYWRAWLGSAQASSSDTATVD